MGSNGWRAVFFIGRCPKVAFSHQSPVTSHQSLLLPFQVYFLHDIHISAIGEGDLLGFDLTGLFIGVMDLRQLTGEVEVGSVSAAVFDLKQDEKVRGEA